MKPYTHLVLFTAIVFAGCLTDSGEKLPDPWPVPAILFKSASVSDRSISMLVTFGVSSSGWIYSHTEQSRIGNTFSLKGFARPPEGHSLPVMSSIDAAFNVTVEAAGTYSFQFWRSDGTTLDTTLTVR